VDGDGNIAGEPLYEWVTTDEPYLFERLAQGDYILREYTAPAGYTVAQDVAFTVEDTGEVQAVEMQDDFTKLEVSKVTSNGGKALAGATLQIIDEDGNVVYEWTTTDEPYLIERIAQGKYTLHEVSAPDGYELAGDISFEVADNAKIQMLSMTDTPTPQEPTPAKPKLDQTGNDQNNTWLAVGLLAFIALGGVFLAVKNLRKKDGADDKSDQQ
jgi:LPXTG-motif cell wall-anchored protein